MSSKLWGWYQASVTLDCLMNLMEQPLMMKARTTVKQGNAFNSCYTTTNTVKNICWFQDNMFKDRLVYSSFYFIFNVIFNIIYYICALMSKNLCFKNRSMSFSQISVDIVLSLSGLMLQWNTGWKQQCQETQLQVPDFGLSPSVCIDTISFDCFSSL